MAKLSPGVGVRSATTNSTSILQVSSNHFHYGKLEKKYGRGKKPRKKNKNKKSKTKPGQQQQKRKKTNPPTKNRIFPFYINNGNKDLS